MRLPFGKPRPEYVVQVRDGDQMFEHRVFGYSWHPAPPVDVFIGRVQEQYPGWDVREVPWEQRDRRLDGLPTRGGRS